MLSILTDGASSSVEHAVQTPIKMVDYSDQIHLPVTEKKHALRIQCSIIENSGAVTMTVFSPCCLNGGTRSLL